MKKVEFVMYNEGEIRDLVTEAKAKVAVSEIRNGSQMSDPTAAMAIRNITPIPTILIENYLLYHPEEWLEVVEITRRWCIEQGEVYYNIMRSKYCRESVAATCATMGITQSYYRGVVDEIRNYAAMKAAWYHLIEF